MREMKDSGIEWIGEIPKDWEVKRFKDIASLYVGNSIKDELKTKYEDDENARPYISSKDIDVKYNTANYNNGLYIKNNDTNFRIAPKNSTLMCIEGGSAGKKKTFVNQDVCFVNKLCCFVAQDSTLDKFLFYFLNNPGYEEHFKLNISGMIGGVSLSTLKNFKLCVPPYEKRKELINFLDQKCFKIDNIRKSIEEQIKTLEDYKKSLITETVTKGLNPNVEMKDSGIEWIGEIPKNWEISKLKYVANFVNGDRSSNYPSGDDIVDNGIIFVTSNNIHQIELDNSSDISKYITIEKYNSLKGAKLELNDIIFCLRGSVGMCAINTIEKCGTIASSLVDIKPQKVNAHFLNYFLQSKISLHQTNLYTNGSCAANLSAENVSNYYLIKPLYEEQQQIVDYLDEKCGKIDEIIKSKQEQLKTLDQYKKSLIYEYVTGKKEVSINE